jgi:hypothetical protein
MTKYIDCEAALAMLHKDEFGTPDERWHPESEIAEAILRVPVADVVPVVRCSECKHCVEHYYTDGNAPYWVCKELDSGTDYDGYCNHGEKNEQ